MILTLVCVAVPTMVMAAETPHPLKPAVVDPLVGDWQGHGKSGYVAQVTSVGDGEYQAILLTKFDLVDDKPVATLRGKRAGDVVELSGDGWTASMKKGHLVGKKTDDAKEKLDLQHVVRKPPTLGAKPPKGAVVLFDGKSLDAWAKKKGKDWLTEDGPAGWKLVDGAMEVVPEADAIISHQKFGDAKIHVEYRTLGKPTNSGVFLQTRYEVNINETYGDPGANANAGLDNCSKVKPRVRPSRPPLEWQTLDIDFKAPRFDASGKKTENARATVLLNGTQIYDQQELDLPHGAAGRLGEAPTGPLMLQEHGQPLQFRNVWLLETGAKVMAKAADKSPAAAKPPTAGKVPAAATAPTSSAPKSPTPTP